MIDYARERIKETGPGRPGSLNQSGHMHLAEARAASPRLVRSIGFPPDLMMETKPRSYSI
jgi:hypothetical protein